MKNLTLKESIRKKLFNGLFGLSLTGAAIVPTVSQAQNTFPATGNVGIGTASPAYPLQINTAMGTGFQINGSDAGWIGMYMRSTNATGQPFYGYTANGSKYAWHYLNPAGDFKINVNYADRLSILANGNVGVGNSNPGFILDVAGRSRFRSGGGTAGFWFMNNANTADRSFVGMADDNHTGIYGAGSGWGLSMNVNNGNVGIGNTTPAYKLHLNSPDVRAFQIDGSNTSWTGMYVNSTNTTGQPFYGYIANNGLRYAYSYLTPAGDWRLYVSGDRLTVLQNGNVGIGTTNPLAPLTVNGLICAKEVRVSLAGAPCWPDYVFRKGYQLKDLSEVEKFITENQHLPGIPSANEVEGSGVELGALNMKLLEKIEEITLYMIDLKKENNELKKRMESIEKK